MFLKSTKFKMLIVLGLIVSLLFAVGCSNSNDNNAENKGTIKIGYRAELDLGDSAEYFGYDLLQEQGYKVEIKHLNESSGVVASITNGEIEIGNMLARDAIIARKKGVPLKIILPSNMIPQFVIVTQPEIKDVQGLKGKNVAYHGPGSATEIFPKMLVERNGMDIKDVNWSILPESPNRAAAMQAKRIDATALEYLDVLTLQGSGDFNIIGSMYDAAPEALESVFVTMEKTINDKPEVLQDFVDSMVDGYGTFYADKDKWQQKVVDLKIDLPAETLSMVYDFFKDIHFYPEGDILTKEYWDRALKYFQDTAKEDIGVTLDSPYEEMVADQFFNK